jgi:hypothetical protein
VRAVASGTVVDIRDTVPDGSSSALPNSDGDNNPSNDDPSLGSGAIGNIITIEYNPGTTNQFYATYMHLENGSVGVAIGDSVTPGEVIGLVGNTGARTGTHLHFQVGATRTSFGATDYGGWPTGTDNASPQTIADATSSYFGTVQFTGYGATLPSTVVGSNLPGAIGAPSLTSVSPNSYPADNNNHTMRLIGSNFQGGDTLTFTFPDGTTHANARAVTFVSSTQLDYQFDDGNDAGNWSVRVNSPDGTQHSSFDAFTVAGALTSNMVDSLYAPSIANEAATFPQQYGAVGFYLGRPSPAFSVTDAQNLTQAGRSLVSIYEHGQTFNDPSYLQTRRIRRMLMRQQQFPRRSRLASRSARLFTSQ